MNLPQTVRNVYHASDGDATKALYARLELLGPVGAVAVNLLRASKSSARAKVYRGGGYRGKSYTKKEWSLGNLCNILEDHAGALGLVYGWQRDEETPGFPFVMYIELPGFGQASFHAPRRGTGPDYAGTWDGLTDRTAERIICWCEALLKGTVV